MNLINKNLEMQYSFHLTSVGPIFVFFCFRVQRVIELLCNFMKHVAHSLAIHRLI